MVSILNSYDENKSKYELFATSLKSLLSGLILNNGITIHSIDSRVKERRSLELKIDKKNKYEKIEDVTDIIGVRVITHYSDDVDKIAKIVEREFSIDSKNSIDKRVSLEPDRFGYLSLHYIISLNENRANLTEHDGYKNLQAEIQIRSILQHAWAEIEHDIGYKSNLGLPDEIRRQFSRLAGLLEIADDEFIKIKESISLRKKEVAKELDSGRGTVKLDKVSIDEYILKSKALHKLSAKLNEKFGFGSYNKANTSELDGVIKSLEILKIKDTKTLETLLEKHEGDIIKRVKRFSSSFIEYTARTPVSSQFIIAFLCQVIIASKNDPTLENKYGEIILLDESISNDFFKDIRDALAA